MGVDPTERDPLIDDVLVASRDDLGSHCRLFHSDRFNRSFSRYHQELFDVINDESIQYVLLLAHRGFGKTSLFNFALPSQHIVHEKCDFIVPVSCTNTQAVMQSENLKVELQENDAIYGIVGEVKSPHFSRDEWTTATGIRVLPRGRGQQIRGILHRNSRPGLVIVDDLEDTESVMSEEQRDKTKEWFLSDVYNVIDRSKTDYRIIVVGTILHEASLLQDLREDDVENGGTWKVLDFPLCDDKFNSRWPEFMTTQQIKDLAEQYRRQGKIEVFYREYMNIAAPAEDRVFKPEFFRYYTEYEAKLDENRDVETILIIDPTKSEKAHSAYSAIVVVGFDHRTNAIYFRDVVNERLTSDALYEAAVKLVRQYRIKTVGVETTGLEEFITKPIEDFFYSRGVYVNFVELKARRGQGEYAGKTKGKAGRVASLAPYYKMGHIFHNQAVAPVLETQLLQFPRPRYWDVMDAFAYVVEMMDLGERFFTEIRTAEARDKGLSEDELFEERCKELAGEFDWMDDESPETAELLEAWTP